MKRVFNFCAGPAALPVEVLEKAQSELLDYQGLGMSVMEMSHRSKEIVDMADRAVAGLRELLAVPDNYEILYLQGGATGQFSAIPMNLLGSNNKVDFIDTGDWSKKAIKEAQKYGDVHIAASTAEGNYTSVPTQADLNLRPDAAYVHYTPNETIRGVEFDYVPDTGDVPLVADMSSTILSRPIDVSKYGLIYAGAQKNIGPSGLCWVIIRKDLMDQAMDVCPSVLNYAEMAKAGSMLNTPPTLSLYLCGLVFDWLKEQGGVEGIGAVNGKKAETLYHYVDQSDFYQNPVAVNARSWMNIPFTLANADLDKQFLSESEAAGLTNLAGHRSVGGMRASIYNAVGQDAVDALIAFMQDFAERNQ